MLLSLTRKLMSPLKKFTSPETSDFRGILVIVLVLIPPSNLQIYYFLSPFRKILQDDPSEHHADFFSCCARSKRTSLASTLTLSASNYMERCIWVFAGGQNFKNTPKSSPGKVRRFHSFKSNVNLAWKWKGFLHLTNCRTHLRHLMSTVSCYVEDWL